MKQLWSLELISNFYFENRSISSPSSSLAHLFSLDLIIEKEKDKIKNFIKRTLS